LQGGPFDADEVFFIGKNHEPRARIAGAPALGRFLAGLKFAIDAHLDDEIALDGVDEARSGASGQFRAQIVRLIRAGDSNEKPGALGSEFAIIGRIDRTAPNAKPGITRRARGISHARQSQKEEGQENLKFHLSEAFQEPNAAEADWKQIMGGPARQVKSTGRC